MIQAKDNSSWASASNSSGVKTWTSSGCITPNRCRQSPPPRRLRQRPLLDDEHVQVAGFARQADRVGTEGAGSDGPASFDDARDDALDVAVAQHQGVLVGDGQQDVGELRGIQAGVAVGGDGDFRRDAGLGQRQGVHEARLPGLARGHAERGDRVAAGRGGAWLIVTAAPAALVGPKAPFEICVPEGGASVSIMLIEMSVMDGVPRCEWGNTVARSGKVSTCCVAAGSAGLSKE